MLQIRTYTPDDRGRLRDLFREAGADSPTETLWGHEDSEAAIYLDPYVGHTPDSVYLAEQDGRLVGYLTGCRDSASFPTESARFDRAVSEHRLFAKPGPRRFFLRAGLDTLGARLRGRATAGELSDPRWPAHLHINVVPSARGTGAADALMTAWDDDLAAHGVPGCHLQTLAENTRAVRFFERHGFRAHGPEVLVPGLRYRGRRLHQLTMVRPAAG